MYSENSHELYILCTCKEMNLPGRNTLCYDLPEISLPSVVRSLEYESSRWSIQELGLSTAWTPEGPHAETLAQGSGLICDTVLDALPTRNSKVVRSLHGTSSRTANLHQISLC